MDRQLRFRLIVLAAVLTMIGLGAFSEAGRVVALSVGIPLAFLAVGGLLWSIPFAISEHDEGHRLRWSKLFDFAEHAGPLAWFNLFVLWMASAIAFMGRDGEGTVYFVIFLAALVMGLVGALGDLFMAGEPDDVQEAWQQHPQG